MRAAAYVLAALVTLPYALLALAFMLLGRAIAAGTLLGFLGTLLTQAVWLVPWGLMAIALGALALVVAGIHPPWRTASATLLCLLALASMGTIGWLSSRHMGAPELTFLLPCLVSAAVAGWLALTEGQCLAAAFPAVRPPDAGLRGT